MRIYACMDTHTGWKTARCMYVYMYVHAHGLRNAHVNVYMHIWTHTHWLLGRLDQWERPTDPKRTKPGFPKCLAPQWYIAKSWNWYGRCSGSQSTRTPSGVILEPIWNGEIGSSTRGFLENGGKKIPRSRFRKNVLNLGSRNLFQAFLYHLAKSHLAFFFFALPKKRWKKSFFETIKKPIYVDS